MIIQHFNKSRCVFEGHDGACVFTPSAGTFSGSSIGTALFNKGFAQEVTAKWDLWCQEQDNRLTTNSIVDNEPIDLASTIYVDDIAKRTVATSFAELVRLNCTADRELTKLCKDAGLGLKGDKKETIVTSRTGFGSASTARKLASNTKQHGTTALGKVYKHARYLGPHLYASASFIAE